MLVWGKYRARHTEEKCLEGACQRPVVELFPRSWETLGVRMSSAVDGYMQSRLECELGQDECEREEGRGLTVRVSNDLESCRTVKGMPDLSSYKYMLRSPLI